MNRKMRFLAGVLAILIFALTACTAQPVPTTVPTSVTEPTVPEEVSADSGYLLLSPNRTYPVAKAFSALPRTIEVKLQLGSSYKKAGGIILGTADNGSTSIELTLREKGAPCLCYYDGQTGKGTEYLFNEVDVRSEKAIRLTIVREETQLLCYVDGALQQTLDIEATQPADAAPEAVQLIGGDLRANNSGYFKGKLYHLALWSEAKPADAVAAFRIEKLDPQDAGLLAAYDFGAASGQYKDLSNHGYDLTDNLLTVSGEPGVYSKASAEDGLAFEQTTVYGMEAGLSGGAYTVAAWLYLPEERTSGAIFGSRQEDESAYLNVFLNEEGNPQLQYLDAAGTNTFAEFEWVHITPKAWNHLALAVDKQMDTVHCYLNGSFAGSVVLDSKIQPEAFSASYALGSDFVQWNANRFTGRLLEVAVYSESLSPEEIGALYSTGVQKDSGKLLAYYPLGDAQPDQNIADAAGNGHTMTARLRYHDEVKPLTDYAYSFALIGDIQNITYGDVHRSNNDLPKIYDWLLANKDAKKIRYVFGLGDITDKNEEAEWKHASAQQARLDGVLPYSVVRGNHDVPKSTSPDYFTMYFGTEAYKQQFANGGFYSEENISNAWCTFEVGRVSYLLLALDVVDDEAVLQWANDVIAAHPSHNVIVTTHVLLHNSGELYDKTYSRSDEMYNGIQLWDELISKHENIVLAICGHNSSDNIRVTRLEGEKGNTVTILLVDPQSVDLYESPSGMVAMLYFSEDGRHVQAEYYSTVRGKYFLQENRFDFELPVVGD